MTPTTPPSLNSPAPRPMVERMVITIDEEKCDGCGLCVTGCHEGALQVIDGKARMVRDQYCDGLGACIGECPRDAIRQERRMVAAFHLPEDHPMHGKVKTFEEVEAERLAEKTVAPAPPIKTSHQPDLPCGCPGSHMQSIARSAPSATNIPTTPDEPESELGQWPVQLRLVPAHAPYLRQADLLVCADCVPFAVADFHHRYLRNHAVVVGCPKLDDRGEMAEKLAQILATADIRSLTVLRMEVPCCGGIAQAALAARQAVCPELPCEIHTVGIRSGIRIQAG